MARLLRVSRHCVALWRKRFRERGMAGLYDEARCGAPRKLGAQQVHLLLRRVIDAHQRVATIGSRDMAADLGVSQSTVSRICRVLERARGCDGFFRTPDQPGFIRTVRAIAGAVITRRARLVVLRITPPGDDPSAGGGGPPPPRAVSKPLTEVFQLITTAPSPRRNTSSARHATALLERLTASDDPCAYHVMVDSFELLSSPGVQRWFSQNPRAWAHLSPSGDDWARDTRAFIDRLAGDASHPGHASAWALLRACESWCQSCRPPFVWPVDGLSKTDTGRRGVR